MKLADKSISWLYSKLGALFFTVGVIDFVTGGPFSAASFGIALLVLAFINREE